MATLTLRPNGNGDVTQMTRNTGNANWGCMDEVTPDEFGTYCTTDNASKRDLYAFEDHGAVTGKITSVEVKARGCSHPYNETENGMIFLKTHGTEYPSDPHIFSYHVWEYYSKVWTTNPYTGVAWTWAEIDALQAGCGWADGDQATAWTWIAVIVTYTLGVAYTQTISETLGMVDSVPAPKAAFKIAVPIEKLGMVDSVTRARGFPITITEILGLRDRLEARKHAGKIGDLPDNTITGGA